MTNSKQWDAKTWLQIIQGFAVIIGVFFAAYQLYLQTKTFEAQTKTMETTQRINSATFILKLSDELDKPKYDGIMKAIDENTSDYPIRTTKIHKGFRDRTIEDYIGTFETVGNLVKEEVITESMAYDELGYEIEKAWCNKDVHRYINDERKADKRPGGPNAFYIGFEELAKSYLKKDNKTCETLDQETTE